MKSILFLSLISLFLCHSISQNGINLIKRFEGCRLTAYQDSVGVWTIGYGTTSADQSITGTTIYKGLTITQSTADEWLRRSLNKKYGPKVDKFDNVYHWNQNEFDALCSFAYNIGSIDGLVSSGKLSKSKIPSTMKLYVYAKGQKLKGLVTRRNAEVELFLKDGGSSPIPTPTPTPTPTPSGNRKWLPQVTGYNKNDSLMDIMEENEMPKIDYHDYNLGLYLYTNNIPIKYLSKQSFGTIQYRDFDYQNIWVSKYSGYYSNFFAILKTLINFDLPIFHKIFILFQLIGILIEFIYPGLSILVIYSIFVEAFDIQDTYPAWFMTMLYIIMYLGSGVSSLISEKPRDTSYTNLIYYYFMEVYYLFILVCSIPAMDNIKKKKLFREKYDDVEDFYKFNTAAITCLIIFTFLLSILPMIFRISMITDNIVSMLLYLVLGAPMSTSNLLIAKIWNAPGAPGGKSIDDRKGITILFFFLFNLFFGFLSAYIYDRKLRANCVMGLAIFYLIYLFFKIFGIIISLMGSPDLTQKKTNKAKSILEGKNTFDSKNSSDHINEEKLDNDNDNENGNNEENKEEHSKENDQNENQNEDNNEEKK